MNNQFKILVTGSSGLIGTALFQHFRSTKYQLYPFDIRNKNIANGYGDVLQQDMLRQAMQDCIGVVHLAAVSRVIWGERDPKYCWQVNVDGTNHILQLALTQKPRPWLIFASSREVYGQASQFPVTETANLKPINIYACSKVEAEWHVQAAQVVGLPTAIIRFSSVYGSTQDHPDRVIPAFARAAVLGTPLQLEGSGNTFDFTHVNDSVQGLIKVINRLQNGDTNLPPIHFTTGVPTSLAELARLANQAGGNHSSVYEKAPRQFDVNYFYGDPTRAKTLLGWQPTITIQDGIQQMVKAFSQELVSA